MAHCPLRQTCCLSAPYVSSQSFPFLNLHRFTQSTQTPVACPSMQDFLVAASFLISTEARLFPPPSSDVRYILTLMSSWKNRKCSKFHTALCKTHQISFIHFASHVSMFICQQLPSCYLPLSFHSVLQHPVLVAAGTLPVFPKSTLSHLFCCKYYYLAFVKLY